MTELQQNRYDALLRRVGDLKGSGSKVNDVLEELFPTIDVENVPGELLRLMGTRLAFGGGNLAGVVAESGKAQLFNPAGSDKLVTITSVYFATTANDTIRWGVSPVSFANPVSTQVFRDTRDLAPALPTAQIHQDTTLALAAGTNQTRLAANDTLYLKDRNGVAVLAPGTGFEIGAAAQNTSILWSFYWRERLAEPSELNL